MQIEVDGFIATVAVSSERDPYGTGDSPEQYYVEILEVVNEDGEVVEPSDHLVELIEDEAIGTYIYG